MVSKMVEIHVTGDAKRGYGVIVIGENCLSLVEHMTRKDLKKFHKQIKKQLRQDKIGSCMRGLEKCSKDCDKCPDTYSCSESSK